ncbi:glycosyltransferase family 2 protein [Azohydromonas caseinilytica]|uniref:Glycosyltransferase family 2 protein n=1 Tax=Azohydromonas caseinilytica TaxID=2728836 RepID=A0A848FAH2_9BURK|nr:glycosyltransferase family 2 protein [Azohydromonas caseinilytica]NML17177.1 glycosyltransferase family 2 protein [Azohydromonas caseinilytica]
MPATLAASSPRARRAAAVDLPHPDLPPGTLPSVAGLATATLSRAREDGAPAAPALPPHRLSVVVPMYNEVDNAAPMLDAVQAALQRYPHPWELIVVDDGSTDGTAQALERHAAELGPHVRLIRLWRNFRQTAALQAGIDAARGDVIVTLDGDLQNDPRDIPRLVARLLLEDKDLVAGWRRQRQDDWLRCLPSRLANRLIARTTGLRFQDLGCSLKAYRAGVLRQVRLYGEMHRFIPAWLATVTSPARMAEEPVRHHPRRAGRSKYGLLRTFGVLVDLLAVHFFLHYSARPGHFFGGIGLALTAAGGALLGWLAWLKLVLGQSIGTRPLLALGFWLVLGGLQFLTTGVLAELLIRIYHEGGRHPHAYHATPAAPPAPASGWHLPGS